jgi:peptide chain release factor 2
MDLLVKNTKLLHEEFEGAFAAIGGEKLEAEHAELTSKTEAPDFWSNSDTAQDVSKKLAKLDARLVPWLEIKKGLNELSELLGLGDDSMAGELEAQYQSLSEAFTALKAELKFAGPYNDHDAIVTISAGAGGVDAMDWAEMLERMYLRWAEQQKYKVDIIDRSAGDEAGLKSCTFEVSGKFVYAYLKGEHGVHRLVRLSPFNSDNLRQTSFAKVEVVPVIDTPEMIEIDEQDLKIEVAVRVASQLIRLIQPCVLRTSQLALSSPFRTNVHSFKIAKKL